MLPQPPHPQSNPRYSKKPFLVTQGNMTVMLLNREGTSDMIMYTQRMSDTFWQCLFFQILLYSTTSCLSSCPGGGISDKQEVEPELVCLCVKVHTSQDILTCVPSWCTLGNSDTTCNWHPRTLTDVWHKIIYTPREYWPQKLPCLNPLGLSGGGHWGSTLTGALRVSGHVYAILNDEFPQSFCNTIR